MANEKILILEAWADDISDTRAVRDFYASAERLMSVSAPVRIIGRPLLANKYTDDVSAFLDLECNLRGPNIVIFSAHGGHEVKEANGRKINKRTMTGHDGDINISTGIRRLNGRLERTIIILDSCKVGNNIGSFHDAAGAHCVVGFTTEVDWTDSAVFLLALLMKLQENGILHQQRLDVSRDGRLSSLEKVLQEMKSGQYRSLAEHLGFQYKLA
ncbi:MAG: hypothetical protein K2X41_04510 [Hyphomicrobium sp.]|nr:hypothetical protein [Hyphomicrobium sp.]